MSFGGPGVGGSSEMLAYMIKAFDDATPVFRAFGRNVDAVTKSVQSAVVEMNKAMAASGKGVVDMAAKEEAAMGKVGASARQTAAAAGAAAREQEAAAKQSMSVAERQAALAQRTAAMQKRSAAESAVAFGTAGAAATKMGRDILIATAAAGVAFLDLQGKFQANTLRMQTQAGATAHGLDQIRKGLLAMAGQVGATPDQLANGMYHVVSAMNAVLPPATRVRQELTIMKIAAEGAQVGHANLEETTYALTSALNALHKTAKDAGTVMGQLNAIVGSGDMTMADLLDAFKSGLIPAADSFHISLQSVGAALSVMGDMGMRGALAGTRLRMALSLLAAPTDQAAKILQTLGLSSQQALSTSEAMSKALTKAGVNTTQLSADLRKPDGLQVALNDLNKHLMASGLSSEAAGATISRAFGGGRMGAAITLLAENTDRLKLKFDQIGQTGSNFGKAWQLTSQTFRVELDRAVASIEAFGVKVGEWLLPYAGKALKDIEDLTNWFSKNDEALRLLGGTVITFASVAIGSYFISKITKAIDLMKSFGGGVVGISRWMLGIGSTPTGATGPLGASASPVAAAGAAGGALGNGPLTNIVGFSGRPVMAGSKMNPIAVTIASTGLSTGAASSTEAQAQRAAGLGPAARVPAPGETVVPTPAFGTTREAQLAAQGQIAASVPGAAAAAELSAAEQAQAAALDAQTAKYDAGFSLLNRDTMALQADTQLAARAMGQVAQELDLFQGEILKMEEGLAMQGEQLTLGGIAAPLGAKGEFKTFTAEEQLAASQGGPGFWSRVKGAPGAVGSAAQDAAGFAKTAGSTAMRAGVLGGTIFLGSQLAGQMIPGQAGQAVSHVGTTTAIGATAGSLATLIPDVGPMVGPLVGALSGAIIGGLAEAFKKPDWGKKIADNLPSGFGGARRPQLESKLSTDLNAMAKLTESTATRVSTVMSGTGPGARTPGETQSATTVPIHLDFSQLTTDKQAQYLRAARDAGHNLGGQLEAGWNQYKFQSEPVMFKQLKSTLAGMPPAVQAYAIQSAVSFSTGLEHQGRLVKGSTDQLLQSAMQAFPKFGEFLGLQGAAGVKQFTDAMNFDKANQNSLKSLNQIAGHFAVVTDALDGTGQDVNVRASKMITALKGIADNGTGPMKKQAQADIKAVRDTITNNMTSAGSLVVQKTDDMASSIKQGGESSAKSAETNFTKFFNAVSGAMTAGDLATSKGMQIIAKTTDDVIKALGGTPIPIPQLVHAQQLTSLFSQGKTGVAGVLTGAATGGKITMPGYMVGEEAPVHPEYVLSTNPAYRPRNVKLWQSWAQDVGIPGFAQGGYIDPIAGFHLGRTDMGVDASAAPGTPIVAFGPSKMVGEQANWYAGQPEMVFQLTGGPDTGRYWYVAEQIVPLAHVGQQIPQGGIVARYASKGTGIEIGWAANASGTTLAQATSGYHEGQVTPAGRSFLPIVGGPGGTAIPLGFNVPSIKSPKVSGHGAISTAVQAALKVATAAANQYIGQYAGATANAAGAGTASGQLVPGIMSIEQQAAQIAGIAFNSNVVHELLTKESSGGINEPPSGPLGATGPNQVTPSTFRQYELPGHTNINNPLDNAIASMRYIGARYHSLVGMAQTTGLFTPGYKGYKMGGRIPAFAGAFGDGGMFTANGPTMAVFGERGPEDVMAVPHFQTGGIFASTDSPPLGSPQWNPAPASQVHVPPPATKTTKPPVKRYHYDSLTGQIVHVTAEEWNKIAANIAYVRAHEPAKIHQEKPTPWYDPALGKIIEVTPSERSQLVADNAMNRAKASAASKAHQKWLSGRVTDVLSAGGVPTGEFDLTRRQAIADHLPMGGSLDLINKDLVKLTETAWNKVAAALKKGVADMPEDQIMKVARTLSRNAGAPGSRQAMAANIAIAAGLKDVTSDFSAQQSGFQRSDSIAQLLAGLAPGTPLSALHLSKAQLRSTGLTRKSASALIGGGPSAFAEQINQLQKTVIPEYSQDAAHLQTLYKDALKTHNKKLQNSLKKQLDAVTQAQVQAYADLQTAQVNEVEAVYTKAQNKINKAQGGVDLIRAFQGLPPGTTAASLGLSSGAIQALGLSGVNLGSVAGGTDPMAAYAGTSRLLTGERSTMVDTLNQLVSQLPTLSGTALDQANQHILDLSKSIASVTQEMNQDLMDALKAAAQAFQTQADLAGGRITTLASIANLPTGTNLSALGLTPAVLASIGIDPNTAASVLGGGPSAISAEQQAQGGQLTPAQIAAGQSYYSSANQGIRTELGSSGHQFLFTDSGRTTVRGQAGTGLEGELSYDETLLPSLTGQARTDMVSSIESLITTIAGLGATMNDNTDAMNKLTTATNANTSATGQMTGTVAYSYQGQSGYTANLSSDDGTNLGVGG